MLGLVAISCLVVTAAAIDLDVGHGGELIFHKNVTRSPTIWRHVENMTIDSEEPITRIVVHDNREDKNGEVNIVEGGLGFNNVTLELKSPAVFRGYYFEVQVYAEPGNGTQPIITDHNEEDVSVKGPTVPQWIAQHPEITGKDSQTEQHNDRETQSTLPHLIQHGKDDDQQQQQQSNHQQSTTEAAVQHGKDDDQQQENSSSTTAADLITQAPVQQGKDSDMTDEVRETNQDDSDINRSKESSDESDEY